MSYIAAIGILAYNYMHKRHVHTNLRKGKITKLWHILKNLKEMKKQQLIFFVTFLTFSFFFYLRLMHSTYFLSSSIWTRPPGILLLSELGVFFHLIAIGMFIFSILMLMRGTVPPSSRIGKTLFKIKTRFDFRYNEFLDVVSKHLFSFYHYRKFAWGLLNLWGNTKLSSQNYQRIIINTGIFFPPVILAVTFLFDLLILKEFWLFPKSVIIMFIPPLIHATHWLIKDYCSEIVTLIESVVEYVPIGKNRYMRLREEAKLTHTETYNYLMDPDALSKTMDMHEEYRRFLLLLAMFEYQLLLSSVRKYYQFAAAFIWVIGYSVLILKAFWV